MDNEQVLQIITRAGQEEAQELDLSGRGLTSLPAEIRQLSNIRKLELRDNELSACLSPFPNSPT